jgi:hypothetical protein
MDYVSKKKERDTLTFESAEIKKVEIERRVLPAKRK